MNHTTNQGAPALAADTIDSADPRCSIVRAQIRDEWMGTGGLCTARRGADICCRAVDHESPHIDMALDGGFLEWSDPASEASFMSCPTWCEHHDTPEDHQFDLDAKRRSPIVEHHSEMFTVEGSLLTLTLDRTDTLALAGWEIGRPDAVIFYDDIAAFEPRVSTPAAALALAVLLQDLSSHLAAPTVGS